MTGESTFRIALLLPDLMGTYGDRGNAIVLQQRLTWRGIDAETVTVLSSAGGVPESCDFYLIGGGEDVAQTAAVRFLRSGNGLRRAVEAGVPVLGICGALQVLGTTFVTGDNTTHHGLGMVEAVTAPGSGRAIGELTTRSSLPGLGVLTGFENHLGRTRIGAGTQPLGWVTRGIGNGYEETEGAVCGHIVCTYMHGPLLARNPRLADLMLEWAVGAPLQALPDIEEVTALRAERTRPNLRAKK